MLTVVKKRGRPPRIGRRTERCPWALSAELIGWARDEAFQQGTDPAVVLEQAARAGLGKPLLNLTTAKSGPADMLREDFVEPEF